VRARVPLATTIAAFAAILACGQPAIPADSAAVDHLCTSACTRRAQCLAGEPPLETCRADCAAHRGRWAQFGGDERNYWRSDYVAAVVHCTDKVACDVIDDGARYRGECLGDTEVQPNDVARDFCERLDRKLHECGGRPSPRCLDRFGMMSDAALKGLIRCIDQECRESARCWSAFLSSNQN
jgi:hypothetical protein